SRDEEALQQLEEADVAIDFSTPSAVIDNIYLCFEREIPVVVGTTGWYGKLQELKDKCEESNNSLLYASNFSIGVNTLFRVNKMLAEIMNGHAQYDVLVEEIHHTEKLDTPSGTAMTLAEGIIGELDRKDEWVNEPAGSGDDL